MHIRIAIRAAALVAVCGLGLFVACGPQKVCTISPIDIEELKADNRDLDVELEKVRARLATAQADLAQWQAKLAEREQVPAALRAELAMWKKKSGRTETIVIEDPVSDQAQGMTPIIPVKTDE